MKDLSHAGDLLKEWLEENNTSMRDFARSVGIPYATVKRLSKGRDWNRLSEQEWDWIVEELKVSRRFLEHIQANYKASRKAAP